jgi:hypothetical protein
MARRPYVFQEYPKRVWHPETGDFKDAQGPTDVPAGWLDRHPADPVYDDAKAVPKADKTGVVVPLLTAEDRTAIIEELRRRGVSFNSRAPTPALLNQLRAQPG